jgi:hypothetical protein
VEFSQATSFQHSTPVPEESGPQIRQGFAASAFKLFPTSDNLAPQSSTYTFGDFTDPSTHVSETQEDSPEFDTASKQPNKQSETTNPKPIEPPIQKEAAKNSKRASKACKEPNVSTPATPSSAANKKGMLYKQRAVWTEDEILVLIEAKCTQDAAIAEDGRARAMHTTANVKWDAVCYDCAWLSLTALSTVTRNLWL